MNSFYRPGIWYLLLVISFAAKSQSLEFVENKGQWDSRVRYKSDLGGSAFFLQQKGYKVLLNNKNDLAAIAARYSGHDHGKKISETARNLSSPGPEGKVILHSHAYEVNFAGASDNVNVIPEKPIETYNNYFLGDDPSKWASKCKIYRAVVYENIYPGIDVRYYTDRGNLKYDLIVHPGANPAKIALTFDGTNGISLKNNNLIIKTSLGEVTEMKPYCYQLDNKGRSDVVAKYVIEGNTVKFKLDGYSRNATLVIDPVLIFASFTFSQSDNWGYTATYDGAGNFYAGGISFGTGYPVSTGAYQTTFGGGTNEGQLSGYDCGIIKLSSDGSQRMYGTYLGGSSNEQPHSLIVDNNGNLIIAGRTNSGNFPVTSAVIGPGGMFDIFISKLNADGTVLTGSRKIGGTDDDGVNIRSKEIPGPMSITRNYGDDARSEVIVDNSGNIYLASCTQSNDFPVTAGAFQRNFGGAQDGVLIKADPNLTNFSFISYLGGSGDDATFVLALNPNNNNIYVGGATVSNNLAGTGSNNGPIIYSSFRGGACDGFVSIINNNGSALIKTSYVGTSGNDMLYGVQFDRLGYPYIMGTTTVAFAPINSPFNQVEQANGKQYVTKLQPDLSGVIYSANFGKGLGVPDISPTAFLVDRCENVYVAGWGGGINVGEQYPNANTSGLKTTPDAIRPTSDGSDFYFFVLEKNALSQLYGTFYGNIDNTPDVGDHVDGGTSRFDKEGIIYEALCANCGLIGNFPTTPGVWGPDNPAQTGAQCNQAMVKIAFEFAGVGAGIRSSINGVPRDTSGCLPLTVDFTDTIANGKKYIWSFSDGSPDVTTTVPSVQHTFNTLGRFLVRLIAVDSATCNIADTSYIGIRVRDDKAKVDFTSLKLLPCESLNYQFTNTSVAPPGKPFGPSSFVWSFGDGQTLVPTTSVVTHTYPAPGAYNVALRLVDTNYCNSPDSLTALIRVAAFVEAQFETPPAGCVPYTAVFNNTSLAGQQFFWDFGDGTTSIDNNPVVQHTYNTIGTFTVKLVAVDSQTCNPADTTEQTIIVSAKPTAVFTFGPKPPQENTATEFMNFSLGATSYKWKFGDGDSLVTTKRDTIIRHIYNRSGIFNACLYAYNEYGCVDSTCQPVQAIVVPLVDVPNAFTPNGDGMNDRVSVKSYGIEKMDWRIYNRWGVLVYQGNNQDVGWDGMYKGTLQPQEVYVYVLDVTFTDGSTFRKKGDITLLR